MNTAISQTVGLGSLCKIRSTGRNHITIKTVQIQCPELLSNICKWSDFIGTSTSGLIRLQLIVKTM